MDENLKASLDDIVKNLTLYAASTNDPVSPWYCTVTARKIKEALDACKEAQEKLNAP